MLPVAISLLGTKLRAVSVLFVGWFGPRGIASILYVLTVVAAEDLFGRDTIYTVVMVTIFLSVLAHGMTAAPLSDRYGKRIAQLDKRGAADSEMRPVPEMPTRGETAPVAVASSGSGS
jgi:NhaP-type Na+/H+ or K+/H+ antiporter